MDTTTADYDAALRAQLTHLDAEEAAYEAMALAQDAAQVEAHGVAAFIAYLQAEEAHYQAQAACLVEGFHADPITRSASLDGEEKRPIVRALRERCAAQGCPLCNRTAGCYSCAREAGGDPFAPEDQLPQQRIVDEFTTNPADPTTAYTLACGHSII
jgi:hypothetical protein